MYTDLGTYPKPKSSLRRRNAMPAKVLQINFRLKVSTPEYENLCRSVAQAFAGVPGLRWKIWLLNTREKEAGGIYLFESDQALNEFLFGPLASEVESHPAVYNFSSKTFDVMEDVTAVTRGPVQAIGVAS
jgi:hypothetical protein